MYLFYQVLLLRCANRAFDLPFLNRLQQRAWQVISDETDIKCYAAIVQCLFHVNFLYYFTTRAGNIQ